jgi:hypothetical protein
MLDKTRSVTSQPWLRPLTASLAAERSLRSLRPEKEESLSSVVFSPNGLWAAHATHTDKVKVVLWDLKEWKPRGEQRSFQAAGCFPSMSFEFIVIR